MSGLKATVEDKAKLAINKGYSEVVTGLVRSLKESRINAVCDASALLCHIMVSVMERGGSQ